MLVESKVSTVVSHTLQSLSGSFDSLVDDLAPVKLSEKDNDRFEQRFFASKKTEQVKGREIPQLAINAIDISIMFNNLQRLLAYAVTNGGVLEDYSPEDLQSAFLSRLSMIKSVTDLPKVKDEFIKGFLATIGSGQYHIIEESKKYKGGKDIKFVGTPNYTSAVSSGFTSYIDQYDVKPMSNPKNGTYETTRLQHYESEVAQNALKTMDEIHQMIFGKASDVSNAHEWKQASIPVDFDFKMLNQVFARNMGFSIDIFDSIPNNPVMNDTYSFLIMIAPDRTIAEEYASYASEYAYKQENPDSYLEPKAPINEDLVTREAAKLSKFSVSYSIHMPKEFVDYISQTTDGSLNYYALSTWVTQWSRVYMRTKGSATHGAQWNKIPRYIVPASKNSILIKHREENGYPQDPGRVNEDRICVSPRGLLSFMPRADDVDLDNAAEYEAKMEDALRASYAAGAPLTESKTLLSKAFAVAKQDPNIEKSVRSSKEELSRFRGSLIAFNWDYNVFLTTGTGSPFTQLSTDMNGTTTPSALAISDYLGYDFSEEGERRQAKTFLETLNYMVPGTDFAEMTGEKELKATSIYNGRDTASLFSFVYSRQFKNLLQTMVFLARKNAMRDLQVIIKEAMQELDLTDLSNSPLDRALYNKYLDERGNLLVKDENSEANVIYVLLIDALRDATATPGTNLYKILVDEVGIDNAHTEARDHNAYFHPQASSMYEFGNVYNYLGGLVFKKACEAITQADVKLLTKPLQEFNPIIGGYGLPFTTVSRVIMPLAFMYSKYVPNAVDIFRQAEEEAESYQPDESIDVEDIRMPGIAEGSQVFPHQIKAHKYLRRKPKHALLDIHPGGGKTITLLLDIGSMAAEAGEPIKPIIISPDRLCANWSEDLAKITKGTWNAVPITKESFETWGMERLEELVRNAPRNTMFFTGIHFLKNGAQDISYGPQKLKLYGGTEFIKRLGFNYVALDESHKAKTFDPAAGNVSAVHSTVKQIFTMPGVLYTRLLTGTFIHGLLKDAVGQSALFSSHIFRTPDDFAIDADEPDGAVRVRSKLGQHAAVITVKRKEWAFMLPNPIDSFLEIELDDDKDPYNEVFFKTYMALLEQTFDELNAAISNASKKKKTEDSEDNDTVDLDFDEDDELAMIDPMKFDGHMQRLEQILTDPWGDEAFQDAAKAANVPSDYQTPKVRAVVERLDRHFKVDKYSGDYNATAVIQHWEPGMKVRELDVVEYEKRRFMRRRLETDEVSLKRRETPASVIPPTEDTENWKEEMHGKVLIFCRYTRSTDAIYAALPERYKGMARRFHGQLDDKWQQIEDFKNDPEVRILIANEQAISEGHNMQMASRIIRVETPWSPGDYEQSTARIFRPDPSAAKIVDGKPGDMRREVIYIDWLITKSSLEVAKIARLMWKTIDKTKFDEKGNPRYDAIMEMTLDPIKMNIPTLIKAATEGIAGFWEHFEAKAKLNAIEGQEFHEMRKTTLATMQNLPIVPIEEDFARIDNVPILANQKIPDPDGFGLIDFPSWYGQWTEKNFDNNIEALLNVTEQDVTKLIRGLPVRTEFGTGTVVGWSKNFIMRDGKKVIDPRQPVSVLQIRYNANDELGKVDSRKVFVAAKVSQADLDRFFKTNKPWATETERKRIEREARKAKQAEDARREQEAARNREIEKKRKQQDRLDEKKKKREENIKEGRPVNAGITKVSELPKDNTGKVQTVDDSGKPIKDMNIEVIASVYNGFLALHVNADDPDAADLKSLGFAPFGEFAYCEFQRYMHFEKALDYIEDNIGYDQPSANRLGAVMDAFEEETRTLGFNLQLAVKVQADLPNFFRTRHRQSQNRKVIKIYPAILDDRLRLTVDMKTNPLMQKHIGKTMPGAGKFGKWKLHPGMAVFFAVNRTNAKAKIRDLRKAGYTITNMEELAKDLAQLKPVRTREHNRELQGN